MHALLLLALVAIQDRPAITELRTLTEGYARSGCWLPLKVRVGGPVGFEGEITASADAGFQVTRPFRIHANGMVDLLVPVVVLGTDAKVEVVLAGSAGVIERRTLSGPIKLLNRERLVLLDPRHPEFESLARERTPLPDGTPIQFASSDPSDWNEAADLGALEAVDGVVASDEKAGELTMYVWQALGGALVTQPRRDLLDRLAEPAARFPSIDAIVGRFAVNDTWIHKKRDSTLLFIVIYGFGFFVAVYVTWSRKGGAWLLVASAVGISAVFLAAYGAFFPRGNLAIRTWQGVVDAPEAKLAISISALWGSGKTGDVEFGRILKPVQPTPLDASRRRLELRLVDGRWIVRGAVPGDTTRFVTVERLQEIDPYKRVVDADGKAPSFRKGETDYFLRLPRKKAILPQFVEFALAVPVKAEGLIETRAEKLFRVELGR